MGPGSQREKEWQTERAREPESDSGESMRQKLNGADFSFTLLQYVF
jgi:hypothetical protein